MPVTHEVRNQPGVLPDVDLVAVDPVLADLLRAHGVADQDELHAHGVEVGTREQRERADAANRDEPRLRTHDRFGRRIDEVAFHPAWHELLEVSVRRGLTSLPYEDGAPPLAHVRRAAGMYLDGQVEQGHGCPISMTYAVTPALRHQPDVLGEWEKLLTSRTHDPTHAPREEKDGVLFGMGMTEKQGGSDVRANTTTAAPAGAGGPGGEYLVTGHKWFCSAPMSDAFLVLAQAPRGLSCVLVPRFTPDGQRNVFRIQRLKDKLGNRSNASSEVEFEDTWGRLVGEEGRGVPTIIEMVAATRLDCVIGAASQMRHALTQAIWHTSHRSAFGRVLVDQPVMTSVLADLDVEASAATAMMLRLAAGFDGAGDDEQERLVLRLLTPVAKYWVTKRCTGVVREAMECLGGNGYVEESILPRLFRESPLNAIWEGSGNVIALDVLRALRADPRCGDALLDDVAARGDGDRVVAAEVEALRGELAEPVEAHARRLTERLAAVTATALLREVRPDQARLHAATRVAGGGGHLYGTLPTGADARALLQPARDALATATG